MNVKTNDRSIIFFLSLIGFFGIFSTTISKNPVLPLYVKSLNAGEGVLGLIASISPLAGILFSFPVGILADILGKKKLLILSAFIFIAAPPLYLLVNSAYWLIPIRFFHGIATAILGPVASAIICEAYPETKGERLGFYSSASLVGRTLAPMVGGAVISWFIFLSNDWNYKLVYALAFFISLPTLIFALKLKEPSGSLESVKKVSPKDFLTGFKDVFRNRHISGTGVVEMATFFAFGVFETYLPVYLKNQNFPAYQIGILFSLQVIAIAVSKPFFGRISDRVDRRGQIVAGILLLGLSMAAMTHTANAALLILIGIVFGLGISLSTVATSTYVAEVAKKEDLGKSLGALHSLMDIGHSGGPLFTGFIIGATTFHTGFAVSLAVCFLSALIFFVATLKRRSVA